MASVKIVQESYNTKNHMNNLIYYIERKADFCCGYGISMKNATSVIDEFERIKEAWFKSEDGRRQVRHLIVSFADGEVDLDEAVKIAWDIAEYYGQRYQVFYGIHNDTDNIHIHFAINTVSFIDGKMLSEGYTELMLIKENIDFIVKRNRECPN